MHHALPTELRRRLADAPDQHVSQVVALVDAMPCRGEADALIEPLRARLAAMSPVRQLSLSRLLFKPLDPVIVPASRWRHAMPAIPRTALAPIARACLAQIEPVSAAVRAVIAGRGCNEAAAISAGGKLLWPAAAKSIEGLPIPADWAEATGLQATEYAAIRAGIAAALHSAPLLETCREAAGGPDTIAAVRGVLLSANGLPACIRGQVTGLLTAILLADGALASAAMTASAGLPSSALEGAAELTLAHADHVVADVLPGLGLATAAAQAAKVGALLAALDNPAGPPALRGRLTRLRHSADTACRNRLAQARDKELLPRLNQPGPILGDAEMTALEGVARGMRRLAAVSRQFGGSAASDQLLNSAAATLAARSSDALGAMDRLRLIEALAGSGMAAQHANAAELTRLALSR